MERLTERQKRFVDYYIETGNGTEAARLAGYKGNNLNRIAYDNLRKLDRVVKERLQEKDEARIARQDEVLATLTAIMRSEATDVRERMKAAELLGKRYGLFTERVEVSGEVGVAAKLERARKRVLNAQG